MWGAKLASGIIGILAAIIAYVLLGAGDGTESTVPISTSENVPPTSTPENAPPSSTPESISPTSTQGIISKLKAHLMDTKSVQQIE